MQTTTSFKPGNAPDLLSGILSVQVRNEDKITEQDRLFCQNQQDMLYKTLDRIDRWYTIFKEEAEQYRTERDFSYDDNGKISMRDLYSLRNGKDDYSHNEFKPFDVLNDLVDKNHNAIIDIQRPFFLEGDESLLKPMILKDVAERSGLDISTISRVSNSKYVQTNYGIYSLKFFFSDGYTTEDGEELSVREIKRILKECVDTEDKEKPYTDDELAETLKTKGYPIARRTVAKYRQQLNIPVARLRR